MENRIIFILFLLTVVLRHAYSRLSYLSAQLSCSFWKSCIMIKYLLILFVPGNSLTGSVITGLLLVSEEDFYGEEED